MVLLLVFAFLSGLVTILAPCIWPLLPIILSTTTSKSGHQRPLGITLGIMLSFAFFTLCISFLISAFHLDPNILRIVAVIILVILGLIMIVPAFGVFFEALVSRLSGKFAINQTKGGNEFWAGFFLGIALGIVWTPCAGPIFATVATLAATGKVSSLLVLITLVYVIGVGIPLFLFAYAGQSLIAKSRRLSEYTGRIQQGFGVIIILTALAIATNYDKVVETGLLNAFPVLSNGIQNIDNNASVIQQLQTLKNQKVVNSPKPDVNGVLNANYPAPELTGITQWLNNPNGAGKESKPLSIAGLRGKVVLIDFWTYTCINCIRTLPHVTAWYDKYNQDGFVVIGVHTPEFAFEHETNNVLSAIKMFNIHYPVAQDNNYDTWNAFNNEYWPAEYLIDGQGNVRRTEFGEGNYPQMEEAIQLLLTNAGKKVSATSLLSMPDQTPNGVLSPETYLGSDRVSYYSPNGTYPAGQYHFTLQDPNPNTFSLGGTWNISNQYATAVGQTELSYNFESQKVFLVLAPGNNKQATMTVYLDGAIINPDVAGSDVQNGVVTIDSDRLYNLVDLHGKTENHMLKLRFNTPGTEVFAFTFG